MRIGIAQISPVTGDLQANVDVHIATIKSAIKRGIDLIFFPELSLTGFEPKLAESLVQDPSSPNFEPLQRLAEQNNITIGIGVPTSGVKGLNISMLIFHSNSDRHVYSKNILHEDELPYFVSGESEPIVKVKEHSLGLGICYETLQREHFVRAISTGAEIYIACVAKPDKGIRKAYSHFELISKEFNTPIMMVNSVGYCDNFLSGGMSAVWNKDGELLVALDSVNSGLIIYDTLTDEGFIGKC